MEIKNPGHIEYPFYNIAIIRPVSEYVKFFLLVMKSKSNSNNDFSDTVKSFKEIPVEGKQINSVTSYELKIPAIWSDETKAYFEKMKNQSNVDWGAFYAHNDPAYIDWLTGAEGWNHKPEIFMTYLHIAYYEHMCFLDKPYIEKYAGGNGFNGKPVLNLTYQFTTSNNSDLARTTPMFDILRGRYDEHFRRLARDLKEYRHPVIFRLNNEMNTDWTSYCGEVTLLDPDIFVLCWRRLYDIFMEEGVDNTIWVFNPQAITFPYCNWGDALTYMPGEDYIQMLGLTNYEQGNKETLKSFKKLYEFSYNNGTSCYFLDYPWIIGEFGCGAGGETDGKAAGWNSVLQGKWVEGMVDCFKRNREPGYEFCKNIKIAIWFSANDYASRDGKDYISNYFQLDKGTPEALAALRKWFSERN
jgi:beta-mannanase